MSQPITIRARLGILLLISVCCTVPLLAQNVIRDDAAITEASGLKSLGGGYGLRIRSGRLELYNVVYGGVTWTAPTGSALITSAVMRANGNFEVRSAVNVAWQTLTEGHPGAYLTVQTDGNLVIYSRQLSPLWSSSTHGRAPANVSQGNLLSETVFEVDRPVRAGNPSNEFPPCEMVMQSDGNLVVYSLNPRRTATWSSNTPGSPARLAILQSDGNLVLYDAESRPVWSSNTHGNPRSRLELTNWCTARIIDTRGRAIWESGGISQLITVNPPVFGPACPTALLRGDLEFNGNGPRVRTRVSAATDGDAVNIQVWFRAEETGGDGSTTEATWTHRFAPDLGGKRLLSIASQSYSMTDVISLPAGFQIFGGGGNHVLLPPVMGGNLVREFQIVGDTGGLDISTDSDCTDDTRMTVLFQPMQLRVQ